ncbi:unnamed protein product [Enterobius vermicularis]|uniref:Sushi domain-containing protein n=1 Tax=Enterobius vermicularis TaxID=51028 RepID=A0A0N4VBP0_ENTVE|nr:unnamed protein product [Enterobius vermicularis]
MAGTGTKNRRYETVPQNTYDSNGSPIPNQLYKRIESDGSVVYDCQDISGVIRKNKEEYRRPNNHFIYVCDNGVETVKACVGSPRINGTIIPVNEILTVEGFWYNCTSQGKDGKAVYTEEDACNINGKLHHIGDVISAGITTFRCDSTNYNMTLSSVIMHSEVSSTP